MDKSSNAQVQIQVDASGAEGIYSNIVLLAHSSSEFILDFSRVMPGTTTAKVHARIIMTPQNAKSLLHALGQRVQTYESQFGAIRLEGPGPNGPIPGIGGRAG